MINRAVVKTVLGKTVFKGELSPPVTEAQFRRALEQQHTLTYFIVTGGNMVTATVKDPVVEPVEPVEAL